MYLLTGSLLLGKIRHINTCTTASAMQNLSLLCLFSFRYSNCTVCTYFARFQFFLSSRSFYRSVMLLLLASFGIQI